jgi:hypothetical protein
MAQSRLRQLVWGTALLICTTFAHRQRLSRRRWIAGTCLGLAALFGVSAHAEELNDVSLAFLKLHRVPCLAVTKVDIVILDDVVTCDDGREWMLFWLENEVAFVNPETRELYKWQWQLNEQYPYLYTVHKKRGGIVSVGNGR